MFAPSIVALVLGGAFGALWLATRVPGALVAGMAWLLYAPYEHLMYARVLFEGGKVTLVPWRRRHHGVQRGRAAQPAA
jgi:hypothetical protein